LIMILPIFWKITKSIKSKREGILYPFTQLAFEYGLLNTYLYKDSKFTGHLHLLFDKERFVKNIGITTSYYFSICELLADCEYYDGLQISNDYVLISLKIPEEFKRDVSIIESGAYSKVSKKYKEELWVRKRVTNVPVTRNDFGTYIICNDLAYAITVKDPYIKEEIEDILGVSLNADEAEYLSGLNKEKENFVPGILHNSKELLKV
jgi:hypothetical protein